MFDAVTHKKTQKRTGKFSRKLYTEEEIKTNMKEYLAEWRSARPGWNRAACRKYNRRKAREKRERSKGFSGSDGGQATRTAQTENGKRKTENTETDGKWKLVMEKFV